MSREEERLFTAIEKCELPTIKKLVRELPVKEVKDMVRPYYDNLYNLNILEAEDFCNVH
jgi:hypothetical protein